MFLNNLPRLFPQPLFIQLISILLQLQHIVVGIMSQNQGDIQERIAAARREAESLKEKIRAKKESSADTSCTFTGHFIVLVFTWLTTPSVRAMAAEVDNLPRIIMRAPDVVCEGISPKSMRCIGLLTEDISFLHPKMESSLSGMHTQQNKSTPSL